MNHALKLSFFLLVFVLFSSCAIVAGPPGSEPAFSSCDTAASFPYDGYLEGRPNIDLTMSGGVYVWRDGNVWHVRIAKKWLRPQFTMPAAPVITGNVTLERGIIFNPRKVDVSPLNDVRFGQDHASFRFDFREGIGREIEGFDFTVKPFGGEYCITLDIRLNGSPQPGMVYFGKFTRTPENLPLTIRMRSF
ncbi:MAG: hypothetical protein HZA15_03605 [Nitrospirae bacterium]|nr:hypothetical protein [Nitrospirota bacterium]